MTEAKVLTKVLPLENNNTSQKNEENIDNNGEDKISKQSEKAPINDDPINNETVQTVDVNNNNNNIKSEISDIKTIINHNNTCDGPTTSVEQIEAIKENINNEHIEAIEENVNNDQIEAIEENVNNEQIEATEENVNNEQIKALKEITKNDKECTISAATNLKTFDNQQQKVMVSSGVVETKKTVAFVDEVVTEENGKRIGDTEECEEEDEDRFRVDRKKLESLLRDEQNNTRQDSGFFQRIEEATNTTISWPAKLKIGAKSKKDPYIKVAGLPEDRLAAKQMVLSVMDTKSTRVTLKMDVSFTDHSHIIGKGGNTIKKVMKDTQCHIHFPDSNRTSSEKSNQVSIAGPPFCVESARRQIRELLPIVLKFEIPSTALIPDSSSPVIVNIAQTHGVTVSFQQQLCGYGYIGSVRGLHSDPFSVRDAILKVLEHLTGRIPVTVPVTTQFEIDPKHHIYVIGRNGSNIKKITSVCGASIHFADPHDPTTRRSTVTVTGSIESAVNAKVYLLEYLPLILMFDIRDGENEARLEEGALRNLMDSLEVQIIMKPKPRQYCKSLIIKSHEKNASNVYRTRLHLIGEDPANMPFLLSPLATLVMPHPPIHPFHLLPPPLNGFAPPRHPLMNSQSNSPLSPPVQSSSPLIGQNNQRNDLIGQNNQRNTIGSEMKMKRLSFDALITKSSEGESEEIDGPRGNLSGAGLNDSWRNHPQSVMDPVHKGSNGSVDSGLSQSQEELNDNISMTNQMLKNLALHNESKVADDYELRKQMAKNAMHSQVTYGKARTPTDLWSGFGFSNSMPESVIKELWNNREKRMNAKPKLNEIQQSPDGSLNSSHSSHESGSSRVTSNNGVGSPVRRPPPGLEDSFPSRDNLLLLNNNRDFGFSMSGRTSPMNSVYANVKTLAELFEKIGLEQYSEAFVKEEVDLNTFMSLTDQDLKELGVNTFGARKKMQNAMRELQIYQNKQNSPIMPQQPSLSPAFYHHIDVAAHSLRW